MTSKAKKALKITGNVLTVAVAILVVIMTVLTVFSMVFNRDGTASVFGVQAYVVQSDSMTPEFAAGDVIFSEEVNPEELVAGDIITFISRDSASYGQTITHCIREVTTYNGELAFITYGIATGVDDGTPAAASDVLGRYAFRIAGLGSFFEFLKSVPGYIVCILLPFLVIIGLQIANIVSAVRAARAEKAAAAAAERSRVEALEEEVARL
ncbi:MAG: signal peptidase I, partial [Oscillospiraceae bacterium]